MSERVFGRDLKVGDAIEVWWAPSDQDQIVDLKPYTGPLDCFKDGARIAFFRSRVFPGQTFSMTVPNTELYTRIQEAS